MLKARESLQGALSEATNHRYNNAANRAYYAAYQAAVAALISAGLQRAEWYHDAVQSAFSSELIRRRKLYAGNLRSVLSQLYEIRVTADYSPKDVGRSQCEQALRRARAMLAAVEQRVRP
jgi:uncharacterized protein (UPF0332 family)